MAKKEVAATYRVNLFRDTSLKFPELWLEVYLAGEDEQEDALFRQMFARARCFRAKTPEEADLVVFGGGADVDPQLYGAPHHPKTRIDPARDEKDMELWDICYNTGIPMVGICRGAQFGHVMMGGKLYQDVDGHYGDHSILDVSENRMIPMVSSVHHQMVMPQSNMTVVATACGQSKLRAIDDTTTEEYAGRDVEAFFYRDACFFGVQGHPEYRGYYAYMNWFLKKVEDLIVNNPDLESRDHNTRIKKDILERRPVLPTIQRTLEELL